MHTKPPRPPKTLIPALNWLLGLVFLLFFAPHAAAQVVGPVKADSALLRIGADDGTKTPLILIHGVHGTQQSDDVTRVHGYWNELTNKLDAPLKNRYALYVFQYYSDKPERPVSKIAAELRAWIDSALPDRQHVIVAHSMGGLVAKSYMAQTVHLTGNWQGQSGGDTVLGLITLGTPHHGTPGANKIPAVEDYIGLGWQTAYKQANLYYWSKASEFATPPEEGSTVPNRSDLRWDNYESVLPLEANDWLLNLNFQFERYAPKMIAYAGVLDYQTHLITAKQVLDAIRNIGSDDSAWQDVHKRLTLANVLLTRGLKQRFGATDGLVPYKSGLACKTNVVFGSVGSQPATKPPTYICESFSRVRRFEFGSQDAPPSALPDAKTLSITRIPRGFDHLDMYTQPAVLAWVAHDLKDMAAPLVTPAPVITPPEPSATIPTLLLLDTSGSMNENDKIEQARGAALDALFEIRASAQRTGQPPALALFSFAGPCQVNSTRKLSDFSTNLDHTEATLRHRLPSPAGETPLPQGLQVAQTEMESYLTRHPELKEGRIIVLSDGQSTCGDIRPADVFSRRDVKLRRVGRIIFLTVGFDVAPGSAAERDLQFLAAESGGKYFPAQDRRQLSRALSKLVRVFSPKSAGRGLNNVGATSECNAARTAWLQGDYPAALTNARACAAQNPNDPIALYNLALAWEASDRYKNAAEGYRRYLAAWPAAPDRAEVLARIAQLEQDYLDQYNYYVAILRSDLAYLKRYYQSLFNRNNQDLAREFAGFVREKRDFYARLPEILEMNPRWLTNGSRDLADSLGHLVTRINLPTFDRDAVSLLTLPIGQLEELLENFEATPIS